MLEEGDQKENKGHSVFDHHAKARTRAFFVVQNVGVIFLASCANLIKTGSEERMKCG